MDLLRINHNFQLSQEIRSSKYSWWKKYSKQPLFLNYLEGILLIDSHKTIICCNQTFQRLYGAPDANYLIGRSVLEIIPDTLQEMIYAVLELYDYTHTSIFPINVEIFDIHQNRIPVNLWLRRTARGRNSVTKIFIRDLSEWKRVEDELINANLELGTAYRDTLEGWGRALELRDHETQGHTRRVTEGTVKLALSMNRSIEEITTLRYGAMLHDIGKMAIPDRILLKPGPLDAEEWKIMKMHPVYAREMLSEINFLRSSISIPYYHHEKWDGSGYPEGLKGEEIPVEARVFSIIDVWDALLFDRPYRKGWPEDQVLQYICDNKGIHFDPEIADIFLQMRQ